MPGSLWLCVALLANEFPHNNRQGANEYVAKLRADVLGRSYYDRRVPPTSDRSTTASGEAGYYSGSGTDVQLSIRFFKVEAVEPASATMRLKVWVRMKWKDNRLAWDPLAYGNVTQAFFEADQSMGSEASEIWLPDVQPYNALQSFVQTLEPAFARVDSDGTVYWSRPGTLETLCKFSGLVAFPYDNLICKVEVGGWSLSGGQQGLQLLDQGYNFSTQEVTSGSSYQEISITAVDVVLKTYRYDEYGPSEPWPIALYTIKMTRSHAAYVTIVIFPGILITLLSFLVFLTDTGSADALGYGIGVIIVNLLSNFILMDKVPICGEILWVDLFAFLNTLFCCISLLESSINIMLEQLEDDHVLPLFLHVPLAGAVQWIRERGSSSTAVAPTSEEDSQPRKSVVRRSDKEMLLTALVMDESVAGMMFRQRNGSREASDSSASGHQPTEKRTFVDGPHSDSSSWEKLVYFESLFYQLDGNKNLCIDERECDLLLSYTVLDLEPDSRKQIFESHDPIELGDSRGLNRVEFVSMCAEVLADLPISYIERAMQNMQFGRSARAVMNNAYWVNVAKSLDRWASFTVPLLYFLSLIIMFNLDLSDNYADEAHPEQGVFDGIGPARMTIPGIVGTVLYVVAVVLLAVAWVQLRSRAAKQRGKQQEELREAGRKLSSYVSKSKTKSTPEFQLEPVVPVVAAQEAGEEDQ